MPDRWRLFVAVPIGEELRTTLAGAVDGWRTRPDLAGLRWTDPATWHLTLHFLGPTEPSAVPAIVRALEGIASEHARMRQATGGLGGFPSMARARVAWYGVADPDHALTRLADDVRNALASDAQAPFRPHVTLARTRGSHDEIDLRPWIGDAVAPAGQLAVDRLLLMRSHIDRKSARHQTLASVPIGAAVGV